MVSAVSFRSFRFDVSPFSTCRLYLVVDGCENIILEVTCLLILEMIMYQVIFSCYDFVERDLLEWLAGLEPIQDGYDNERGDQGDRAESDDV